MSLRDHNSTGLVKKAKRGIAILTVIMISFSMLSVPVFAVYPSLEDNVKVSAVDFIQHIDYYDGLRSSTDVVFANQSFLNSGNTVAQTTAMQSLYATFNSSDIVLSYKRNVQDEKVTITRWLSSDTPYVRMYGSNTDVNPSLVFSTDSGLGTKYEIASNGTITTYNNTNFGYTVYLNNPANYVYSIAVSNWDNQFYIQNELVVSDFPANPNFKTLTVPAGYGVSFIRRDSNVSGANSFELTSTYYTGIPAFVDEILKGTYYVQSTSLPSLGSVNFSSLNQLTWDVGRSTLGSVNSLTSSYSYTGTTGGNVTFYNPLMYYYMVGRYLQNGPITYRYVANAYMPVLFNIVTSDNSGFIPVGITTSPYQPYDPLPSNIVDSVVEIVDVNDPDYINTSDPDYFEPDPEDPNYVEPPSITPITPPTGGSLGGDDPGTYVPDDDDGVISNIKGFIDDLKNLIIGLFAPATEAIENLISGGSSFMQALSQMYTWLPSDVSVVISSALILLIVIGVLKLLL